MDKTCFKRTVLPLQNSRLTHLAQRITVLASTSACGKRASPLIGAFRLVVRMEMHQIEAWGSSQTMAKEYLQDVSFMIDDINNIR